MADTSAYPGALDGDLKAVATAHVTAPPGGIDFLELLADAVAKIETELGTTPSGAAATVAAAIAALAPLASPAFTGTPTAPTAAGGTNSTQLATTAFVAAAQAALVDSSPAALDTLNELAAALGDDPNFATTVTNALAAKLDTATAASTYAARTVGQSVRAETLRKSFAPPLPQDYPTMTVIPTASSPMVSPTHLQIKRVGDVANAEGDIAGDTRFRIDGTPSLPAVATDPTNFVQAPLLPGGASQSAYYTWTMETVTDAANNEIEFRVRASAVAFSFRLEVNGRHYSMEAQRGTGLSSGSWYYVRLVFPVAASRHIKLTWEGGLGVSGARVPTGQALTRPTTPVTRRIGIIGDSFAGGAGTRPDGALRWETGPYLAALMLGADSVWQLGLGATGYTTANPFGDRTSAVVAADCDMVILVGSRNDGTAGTPTLRAAVDDVLADLATVDEVLVTGPSTVAYAAANSAIREQTEAAGRIFLDGLSEPWLDPATMIATFDGVHPNWLGHQRLASRLHEAISASLAP